MLRRRRAILAYVCFFIQMPVAAQEQAGKTERIDAEIYWKIRREATENSQIMRTLHFLSDVYGPRLTGSPNHKAAADWAVKQMEQWGMRNAHLEPWNSATPAGGTSAPRAISSRPSRISSPLKCGRGRRARTAR